MPSALEHEPELVHGIGLITVRWSVLENDLARLLNSLLKVEGSGLVTYYALANFTQRIDMVERLLLNSLFKKRHRAITIALFAKIKRLWKTRNYLVHSTYVYIVRYQDGSSTTLSGSNGSQLGPHPSKSQHHPMNGTTAKIKEAGFAYEVIGREGVEYMPVNKGTYLNHAEQLRKRSRQIECLWRAIKSERAPLWPPYTASDYKSLVQEHQSLLEDSERPGRIAKRPPRPEPSRQ